MSEKKKYYVVTGKAVPEVLLKVVEAKKLLDAEKVLTCLLYTSHSVWRRNGRRSR